MGLLLRTTACHTAHVSKRKETADLVEKIISWGQEDYKATKMSGQIHVILMPEVVESIALHSAQLFHAQESGIVECVIAKRCLFSVIFIFDGKLGRRADDVREAVIETGDDRISESFPTANYLSLSSRLCCYNL